MLRNEELGFEEGEPCRHHEIIGRQFDAHAARAFHELQILFGERQHRNARQIDLLRARKMQEKIERAFETRDIDDQPGLTRQPLRRHILPELVHRR
ncbi:hypothetical protein D3C86_1284180 [compost metagenome]